MTLDLNISYAIWKTVFAANPTFVAHYAPIADGYKSIVGDGFATYTSIISGPVNVADFILTYLPTAILVSSLDDAKVSIVTSSATPAALISGRDSSGNIHDLPISIVGGVPGGKGFAVVGTDGTTCRELLIRSNGLARTEVFPYLWNIKEGNVPGHTDFLREISMPVNAVLGTPLPFTLGLWNEQLTAAQWSIVSTSALDTSLGTGARKVSIEFINGSGARVTEIITLAGITPVNLLAIDALYIDSLRVIDVGLGQSNAGTISVMSAPAGGGVAVAQILVGKTRMHSGVFYAGLAETVFIAAVTASTSNKGIVFESKHFRNFTGGGTKIPSFDHYDVSGRGSSNALLSVPRTLLPGEKIEIHASASSQGDIGYYSVSGWRE